MATTWRPLTRTPRTWLLTDGQLVDEPALETTLTGIKVRVAGDESVSVYTKDVNDLVESAVTKLATRKGSKPWMTVHSGEFAESERNPQFTTNKANGRLQTPTLWWTFTHATLPISAQVTVQLNWPFTGPIISTRIVAPSTHPRDAFWAAPVRSITDVAAWSYGISDPAERDKLNALLTSKPHPLAAFVGQHDQDGARSTVAALLKTVRQVDQMDCLTIPDLRNPARPAWLELKVTDTNVNAAYIEALTSYLDSGPVVAKAAKMYRELLNELRSTGIVLGDLEDNDFLAGMSTGNSNALTVSVSKPQDLNHTYDRDHTLTMHLPTGTFVVSCNHSRPEASDATAAAAWEEATTIASLTGKADELLAYARLHAERNAELRTRTILTERKKIK